MKNLKYYLDKAYKEGWAIGQFNFSDWSQVRGIVQAAQNMKSPIILGTSEGEAKFVGLQEAVAMRDALRKKTGVPIFLNLDHGKSVDYLKEAVAAGYDMIHFDGSKLPLDENIKKSVEVVAFGKWKGIVVEGEVGRFGTDASKLYTEKFQIKEEDLTKVDEAKEYLKKAHIDVMAVSIGTFHGIDASGVSPHLKLDRLKDLKENVGIAMVLHGGSGTPEEDIKEGIKLGIVKININTETRLAYTKTLRNTLDANKDQITPYKYLQNSINEVQKVIEEKIKLFGSEGKA
ncbi:MAG: class II fructose-bisphosphate aldolase [Candidatus Staskawiczbacteria bacterium]|nr:class II fructose-bisphosphate aldolase [Candidatus Staskawiczbacteria bacterium]